MMSNHRRLLIFSLWMMAGLSTVSVGSSAEPAGVSNWPQWRGPLGTGVAPAADPPIQWSETKNVRWKTELPGLGHSSPIVWGDTIFLTTAVPFGPKLPKPQPDTAPGAHDNLLIEQRHRFLVLAINRADGTIRWKKEVAVALPHEGGHFTASLASNSPVTDGKHVIACFGSRGVFCLNFAGDILWKKSPGILRTKHGHGEGASPTLHDGVVVINRDHEAQSSIVAWDVQDGRQIWSAQREEVTSWSSPVVTQVNGRDQVIVAGTGFVRAYDLRTGNIIWRCGGLSANVVATPVISSGIAVVGSSYDTRAMFAVDLQHAKKNITGSSAVLWQRSQRTPYVPSPLVHDNAVYFLRHYQGILSRVNLQTGAEPTGPFRLGILRDIYASPVCAKDRIYFTDLDGMTMVIQHGREPRPLATNRLNDSFSASAAVVDDCLLLRGRRFLYCLAEPRDEP